MWNFHTKETKSLDINSSLNDSKNHIWLRYEKFFYENLTVNDSNIIGYMYVYANLKFSFYEA